MSPFGQLQCIPRAFAQKWRTGIQFYFAKYETGFQALLRQLDGGDVNEDMADYSAFQLEQLYGHILRLTASHPNVREVEPLSFVKQR